MIADRLQHGTPLVVEFLLDIAAVVIGGASLSGGQGTIMGTIIGTLLISFLRNGCTLLGISTNAQLIVIGMIIVVAVAVDQLAQAKTKKAVS